MSTAQSAAVYDDLLEILVDGVDSERFLAFQLPDDKQARLDDLLQKNRNGTLSEKDAAELDTFEQVEHVVRLLKAQVLQKNNR